MTRAAGATVSSRAAALPPAERRSMIVDAARPLLLEHGESVTTRQIADAAGIAEGTIFRVFPDKDAVIRAVVDAAYDPAPLEAALAVVDATVGFETGLRTIVDLVQQRSLEVWRVASAVGPRFRDTTGRTVAVSDEMVRFLKAHRAQLSVGPVEAAQALRGLTVTLTHPLLIDRPFPPKRIVELFLHGAGA